MIAPDYDGRLQLAPGHQLVQRQPEFVALAVAEPADTRWQSLELHFFLSHGDPALQMLILGEHLEYQLIGACDVGNLTGKRGPAKRASSFAEERPDVGRHKSRKIVRVLHSRLVRERANVVPVIEGY